ncbi:flippase [Flavobacterium sp. MFBS3-15]|uniref:flippase n=1 Tax=Flavobacterium sp. MFBS3-15 TaxID=2989816 RepID=UPI00223622C5|nr:flippase [Flavobacterium sp. MFBS3-15]MCW4469153.1 flippase [Flavobacterium sp. MFBS3-15]
MNSDFKKIISTSGINFLFRIFGLTMSFVTSIMIVRLFGLDVSGRYSIVFTISQAAAMLLALGIPNAMVMIVGNNRLDMGQAKKLLIQGLRVTLLFAALPSLFFFFGSDFIAVKLYDDKELINYFLMLIISLPLFIFHELFLYFFIATKKFIKYGLLMFVLPNVLLAVFLYLFYKLGYRGHFSFLAFALSIGLVVLIEAFLVFDLKPSKKENILSTNELIKTASPMMFSGLFLFLLNWTDVLILGTMVDKTQVGIYYNAFRAGSVGSLVIISVNLIIMPKMAELYGKGNLSDFKKLVNNTTRIVAGLSVPVTAGLILMAPFILSFFDEQAVEGAETMIIIAVGVFVSAALGNVDQILNMSGNARIFRNISLACFFVNIVLNYYLIPLYGINGSAWASLITNVLLNVVCVLYIKKKLGFYTFA